MSAFLFVKSGSKSGPAKQKMNNFSLLVTDECYLIYMCALKHRGSFSFVLDVCSSCALEISTFYFLVPVCFFVVKKMAASAFLRTNKKQISAPKSFQFFFVFSEERNVITESISAIRAGASN